MTYAELHAQHPTPWTLSHCDGSLTWRVCDANGNRVQDDTVVAMMNAAAKEIVDAVEPLNYKAVRACVEGIAAMRIKRRISHGMDCLCSGCDDCNDIIAEALNAVPYRTAIDILDARTPAEDTP